MLVPLFGNPSAKMEHLNSMFGFKDIVLTSSSETQSLNIQSFLFCHASLADNPMMSYHEFATFFRHESSVRHQQITQSMNF